MKATLENYNINLQIYNRKEIDVFGYPNEFSQVVLNIISNAKDILIEKRVEKPKIEIHLSKDDAYAYCEIKDNGGGIPFEDLNKIFEPYFTTKDNSGTGIGLYISKEIIVKHMQGTLEVENTSVGANFIISVPLYEDLEA